MAQVELGAIFIFDGGDLSVERDVRSAEGSVEIYDIDTLRFFAVDGTILRASAEGYRVRLEATTESDLDGLKSELRTYLSHPQVGLDPALADSPAQAAEVLIPPRRRRWFRR